MNIILEERTSGTLLRVAGRMDAVTAPEFEEKCLTVINEGEKMLVIDFSELDYISSAGLRSILIATKKILSKNGSMIFCNLTGMVEEVFQISGLANMFTIKATVEEAFTSCQ